MARPRTIDADCIQTFHCPYVLRTALLKSAATSPHENTSHYIRKSLEVSCQRTLGQDRWLRLQSAANPQIRRNALEAFMVNMDVTRIRRNIDASRGVKQREQVPERLFRAVDDYVRTFEGARDNPEVDLALAVALEEAIDIAHKMKTLLLRSTFTKSALELLQRLASRLPDSLRADFDAAIVSRVVASQVDPAKKDEE